MWFLPVIGAAIALIAAGCGGVPKPPARSVPEKRENEGTAEPSETDAASERCQELATSGTAYVATCHYFMERCAEQRTEGASAYRLRGSEGDAASKAYENFEQCLEASVSDVRKNGPVLLSQMPTKFHPPLGTSFLEYVKKLPHFSIEAGGAPKEAEGEAQQLLREHGFLKRGDRLANVLRGRVVTARRSAKGDKRLLFIVLDSHESADVQRQIGTTVQALFRRGLRLVGAEGNLMGERILRKDGLFEVCSWSKDAPPVKKCVLRWDGYVKGPVIMGVEDKESWNREGRERTPPTDHKSLVNGEIPCRKFGEYADLFEAATVRSHAMWRNLKTLLGQQRLDAAALVVGSGHLPDLRRILEEEDVSFIAIAVRAFDRELEEERRRGERRFFEEHGETIERRGNACQPEETSAPPSSEGAEKE
jgi:hypothetical protein